MGYDTRFSGAIEFSRPLTLAEATTWMNTHEALYDCDETAKLDAMPDSYLQWVPSEDLQALVYDDNEKFYEYKDWLKWVLSHWIGRWGIVANGEILWSGEETDDNGILKVENNILVVVESKHTKGKSHKPLTRQTLADLVIESIGGPRIRKRGAR